MKKIFLLVVMALGLSFAGFAQEETDTTEAPKRKYTRATFNATKIINMQSVETISKGNLQFLISHHFSNLWNRDAEAGENFAQLLGLNSGVANTYLSFDYSVTDNLSLGLAAAGRSRFEGFVKYRFLRQQTGLKNVPVTLTWYSMAHVNAARNPSEFDWNKWSYLHQLLIARKFSDKLSLQLIPTVIHFNTVPYGINNSNLVYSIGAAGKYKLSANKNLTLEYSRQLNMHKNLIDKSGTIIDYSPNLLSLGMEFNTGGHLFQFYIGSTTLASNIEQLARNTSWIKDGHFALGFTINRTMVLKKDKEE
jgi:hypothetical protein